MNEVIKNQPINTNCNHLQSVEQLADGIEYQMLTGQLPDLRVVCNDLLNTFSTTKSHSALQFVPVLQRLGSLDEGQSRRLIKNPERKHVLMENEFLKIVLIHWESGEISSIHGHPKGGGVFKVLQGSIEELRYTSDLSPRLLGQSVNHTGNIAYIDDEMGFHAVGNPFNSPAISLHAYTRI